MIAQETLTTETGKSQNNDNVESLLHEYDSLRSEILATQGHRFQIVAFTLAIVGVILTFGGTMLRDLLLSDPSNNAIASLSVTPTLLQFFAIGICVTLYAIIVPSILMARSAQRSISTIGTYLREQVEPQSLGLNWETRLYELRNNLNSRSGMRGMGGIYIMLSLIPLIFPFYVALYLNSNKAWILFVGIFLFAFLPLWFSWDLTTQCSRSWRLAKWDESPLPDESWLTRVRNYLKCSFRRIELMQEK